jgi:hypothetical protein
LCSKTIAIQPASFNISLNAFHETTVMLLYSWQTILWLQILWRYSESLYLPPPKKKLQVSCDVLYCIYFKFQQIHVQVRKQVKPQDIQGDSGGVTATYGAHF